jgi:uncharacterized protein YycO
MNYEPRVGDFGVVKTNGWIGWLIRLGTNSRWNHTFIYVGDGLIVEANPTGVALTNVSVYPNIAWNHHEELSVEKRSIIAEHAKSLVGKPYGFIDIITIIFRTFGLDLFGTKKFWKPFSLRQGYICSELVAESYGKADVTLIGKPNYLVTPGDLAERLIYQ